MTKIIDNLKLNIRVLKAIWTYGLFLAKQQQIKDTESRAKHTRTKAGMYVGNKLIGYETTRRK